MPLYTYRCNECGKVLDKLQKIGDNSPTCDCHSEGDRPSVMEKVLAIPSPMQWGCRKGF